MIKVPASLRHRYILIVSITLVLAFGILLAARHMIDSQSDVRLENSSHRLLVAKNVQGITKHIGEAKRAIDLYLLSPSPKYSNLFTAELVQAKEIIFRTLADAWVHDRGIADDLRLLQTKLVEYENKINRLMQIAINRDELYPGISIAEASMIQANDVFTTAVNNAILEIRQAEPFSLKEYEKFVNLRDKWRRLIMAYRLYVINRTAGLLRERLPGLQADVNLFINDIIFELEKVFLPMLESERIGFETADAIDKAYTSAKQWRESLIKVQAVAMTDDWRSDVPFILNEVSPVAQDMGLQLDKITRFLAVSSSDDLKAQRLASDSISMFLWLLLLVFAVIFVLVYFTIYSSLLKPISLLSDTLKQKKAGDTSLFNTNEKSLEMNEFVYALNDMQHQINSHQTQLEFMALHDGLTKLPNRRLLLDRLNIAIESSDYVHTEFALIILDLDRFKEVNDTLGHLVGDELLMQVSERLLSVLRETDTVARLGGDEFAILLPNMKEQSIDAIAKKISNELERVYLIREHSLYIGASLGIAIYPEHGEDPETLIQHADVAMYMAKNHNVEYRVYDSQEDTFNIKKLSLLSDLRNALDNNEFFIEYQPIFTNTGERIVAFESLLRWQHPVYGTIHPEEFIGHAEKTGLIKRITQWLIVNVAEVMARLKQYDSQLYLSVNITSWDLQDEGLLDLIENSIHRHKLDYSSIVFELTERSMMHDTSRVRSTLQKLSDKGIRFSVDDFGTGFSSMVYLTRLPISILKIDRTFVKAMESSRNDSLIVNSIIELAHSLNLTVIAEGVEDVTTLNTLVDMQCDLIQGFIHGLPLTLNKVIELYNKPRAGLHLVS